MKRTAFGPDDTSKISIIGGIHGDEPLTGAVILYLEQILQQIQLSNTVQIELILANEKALSKNVRYIDVDLNRHLKTTKKSDEHEIQLAHQLDSYLQNSDSILSLHSSKSVPPVFSIAGDINYNKDLLTALPHKNTVKDTGDGSVEAEYKTAINVEAGHQQTNQVFYNGIIAANTFLTYHNATEKPLSKINHTETNLFTVTDSLPKSNGTPKTYYSNFEPIPQGKIIAEDDNIQHIAQEPNLVPILLSENGYQNQFGLIGKHIKILKKP